MSRTIPMMPPRVRKIVMVVHVLCAVSWLGLTIGDVTMALTALTTDDPALQHAMFRALNVIGGTLLLPVSLLTLLTGLMQAFGTPWGLLKHKWVLTKFLLTSVAVLLTPFSLLPGLRDNVAIVENTPADQLADIGASGWNGLLSSGGVSLTLYTTCLVLSIFKPWGRTKRGQRAIANRGADRRAELNRTADRAESVM